MTRMPWSGITALLAAALLAGCGAGHRPAAAPTPSTTGPTSARTATSAPVPSSTTVPAPTASLTPSTTTPSTTTPSSTTPSSTATATRPTTTPAPSTPAPTPLPPRPAVLAAPGSTGPYVVATQLRLGLAVDGVYGPATERAVAAFQRGHGLAVTGTVGAATWTALQRVPSPCPPPATVPVRTAPGAGRTVALTFDDGASADVPRVLAVLSRFGVHATFFDTGLGDTTYPAYARRIVAAGDVLGNHTWDHPKNWGYGGYFSAATQRGELTRTSAVQAAILGHSPCLMRPPGGAYDPASLALVRSLGMSLVMWTTSASDWQQPPYVSSAFEQLIIRRVEAGASLPHPIILLHVGKASHEPDCAPSGCRPGQVSSFRGNTVAALPAIIEFYRAHGYRFVTL